MGPECTQYQIIGQKPPNVSRVSLKPPLNCKKMATL